MNVAAPRLIAIKMASHPFQLIVLFIGPFGLDAIGANFDEHTLRH
jgi:hypothetical protein